MCRKTRNRCGGAVPCNGAAKDRDAENALWPRITGLNPRVVEDERRRDSIKEQDWC